MEDLSGRQFGPYQIIEPLGEGGMASVFKAYQPSMERYVALKVLPRHFSHDPQFQARFRREAKLLAQLQHPYILPVFDSGQAEGYSYIVMPFVQGGTLADALTGSPVSLQMIRQVLSQVGSALHYAHVHGMIHRDVKPSNILLDESGNCLLTDFGVARMVEASVSLTGTGTVIGTPAYMSPEQGSGKKVDERSDIYSLGIILYEMATGRVPYDAETPIAVIFKHLQDPLPPAKGLNPGLPEAVNLVLLKALSKHPEDRYQSAEQMVEAIRGAIPEVRPGKSRDLSGLLKSSAAAMDTAVTDEKRKSIIPTWGWGLIVVVVLAMAGVFSLALGVRLPAFLSSAHEGLPSLADETPASKQMTEEAAAAQVLPSPVFLPSEQPELSQGAVDCAGSSSGDALTVSDPWADEAADKFQQVLKPLIEACGLNIVTSTIQDPGKLAQDLQTASPDILIWSSVDPLEMSGTQFIDLHRLGADSGSYQSFWLDIGSIGGQWLAMPVKADIKSLIWYSPARFRAFGYQPPETFDQLVSLVNQIALDGRIPLSMGLESGDASGWTASDFIQDILLVQQGPEYVMDLINGSVPYDDPGVVQAYQTYMRWASDPRYSFGGSQGALNTNFMDSIFSVFQVVPYALMVREGQWAGGEIATRRPGYKYGVDFDFFAFPGIKGVQGTAFYLFAARDTPATRALVGYLSSEAGARAWAESGFDLSPNRRALGEYNDVRLGKLAEVLDHAGGFTPDLGDTLGDPFAMAEWAAIVDVLRGQSIPTALSRAAIAQRQSLHR